MTIKTVDQIKKDIANIGKASVKIRTSIQECAVQCVGHARKLGGDGKPINDITLMSRLVKAVSGAVRKDSLVNWFEMYGPCKWSEKTEEFEYLARTDLEDWSEEVQEVLTGKPWEEAKKLKIKSIYSPLDAFMGQMKILEAKIRKGENVADSWVYDILEKAKVEIEEEQLRKRKIRVANEESSETETVSPKLDEMEKNGATQNNEGPVSSPVAKINSKRQRKAKALDNSPALQNVA